MAQSIAKHIAQVKGIGGGCILSEFDCEYARGLGRIREVMELCDDSNLSWIGWQYKEVKFVIS